MHAVLAATGTRQAAIIAALDAGAIALLWAAMHPERVRALVLLNTSARCLVAVDLPDRAPRREHVLKGVPGHGNLFAVG